MDLRVFGYRDRVKDGKQTMLKVDENFSIPFSRKFVAIGGYRKSSVNFEPTDTACPADYAAGLDRRQPPHRCYVCSVRVFPPFDHIYDDAERTGKVIRVKLPSHFMELIHTQGGENFDQPISFVLPLLARYAMFLSVLICRPDAYDNFFRNARRNLITILDVPEEFVNSSAAASGSCEQRFNMQKLRDTFQQFTLHEALEKLGVPDQFLWQPKIDWHDDDWGVSSHDVIETNAPRDSVWFAKMLRYDALQDTKNIPPEHRIWTRLMLCDLAKETEVGEQERDGVKVTQKKVQKESGVKVAQKERQKEFDVDWSLADLSSWESWIGMLPVDRKLNQATEAERQETYYAKQGSEESVKRYDVDGSGLDPAAWARWKARLNPIFAASCCGKMPRHPGAHLATTIEGTEVNDTSVLVKLAKQKQVINLYEKLPIPKRGQGKTRAYTAMPAKMSQMFSAKEGTRALYAGKSGQQKAKQKTDKQKREKQDINTSLRDLSHLQDVVTKDSAAQAPLDKKIKPLEYKKDVWKWD